ncbi:MAG: 30S ribosomal protein S16 [Candidatus Vogelbacteria bacterium]|nr:30S ribosomal protein S16 [Candidatus Vogelbacteria bacterium]
MLIIRLQRVGRINDPSFRVVVGDSKNSAKSGKFLEVVGNYDARQGQPQLNAERIQHWIKNGAQVSDTVHNLLVKAKIIEGKIIVQIPAKKETPVVEAKAPEAPVMAKEATPEAPAEEVKTEEVPLEAETETKTPVASIPEDSGEPKE